MTRDSTSSGAAANVAKDHALVAILITNVITLAVALAQGWSILQLMWPFWIQSMIIGWFARQRILKLNQFCTEGYLVDGKTVEPNEQTQRETASFFVMHFGFFHAMYLLFLLLFTLLADAQGFIEISRGSEKRQVYVGVFTSIDVLLYLGLGACFWISHWLSHREHVASDLSGKPNIGTLMFLPYARILPMHVCIIVGLPLAGAAVWLFVILKTAADLIMHTVEHRVLQGNQHTT